MRTKARSFGAAILLSLSLESPLLAQADTIPKGRLFGWRDLAILEAFAILAVASAPLDRRIARELQDSTLQSNMRLRKIARFVRTVADPGAYVIGATMYAIGRATRNEKAADLGLHGTEALVLGHGLALLLKGTVGRARPYENPENPHDYQLFRGFGKSSRYRSMPSSHTISAFAAASAVTSETSRWWPSSVWYVAPAMYGGAAIAGISRMYNNRHWASDVITGAAIGTMTGILVVRWHHMNPGNVSDRFFLGASVRSTSSGRVVSLHAFPMF